MEGETICRYCRAAIQPTDFFCPNCGKKLKDKPLSTSVSKQIAVYLIAIFLPPFGLWWTYKYIRQGGSTSKKIGIAIIVLTVISLAANIWLGMEFYNTYIQLLNSYSGGVIGY